jgi:ubiquitin C-terminal hydrolase
MSKINIDINAKYKLSNSLYSVIAVSHHIGRTVNSGHNYVFMKFTEGWTKIDDKDQTSYNPKATNIDDNNLQSIGGENAFIFILRKVGVQ